VKVYGGVEIMLLALLIVTICGGVQLASCPGYFTPKVKPPPLPFEKEGGWAPEPVWVHQRREKSLASGRNKTDSLVVQPIT
jgi:hypothetical protein